MAFISNRKPIPAITSFVTLDKNELTEVFQNVDNFSETVTLTHNYYILQYDVEFGVPELDEAGEPALDDNGLPITNDIETDNSRWLTEPSVVIKVEWVNRKPKVASPFPNFVSVSFGAGFVTFSGSYYLWFDIGRNFNWVYSLSSNDLKSVDLYEEVSSPVVAAVDMNGDLRERDVVIYNITCRNFDRVAGGEVTSNHTVIHPVKNHWDLDRDQTKLFGARKDAAADVPAAIQPQPLSPPSPVVVGGGIVESSAAPRTVPRIEDPILLKMSTDSLLRVRYREFIKYYLKDPTYEGFFVSSTESDEAWKKYYKERYY